MIRALFSLFLGWPRRLLKVFACRLFTFLSDFSTHCLTISATLCSLSQLAICVSFLCVCVCVFLSFYQLLWRHGERRFVYGKVASISHSVYRSIHVVYLFICIIYIVFWILQIPRHSGAFLDFYATSNKFEISHHKFLGMPFLHFNEYLPNF